MTKRIILVHGFNVSDGGLSTIDRLIPALLDKGAWVIKQFDYGWRGLLGVRIMSTSDAKGLMKLYKPGDIVIGHSNGCALIALAIEKGMPVTHCIFIHPALNKGWCPPMDHPVKQIHVYYSSQDRATWWARLLPFHKWGAMGTVGPTADDPRLIGHPENQSHSGGFAEHPEKYLETLP